MQVSGIILAGGLSSRLGRDKTLLRFNNETLIERTIRVLKGITDEVIIASNHTRKYNLPGLVEVPDTIPGMGPLGGMHAGLMAAKYQYSLIISCDLPFFTTELTQYLLDRRDGYDVVVPEIKKRWEPLCAVYSKNCINHIEECLRANVRQVFQFYSNVKVLKIGEDDLARVGQVEDLFYNLNTPEDYGTVMKKVGASCS